MWHQLRFNRIGVKIRLTSAICLNRLANVVSLVRKFKIESWFNPISSKYIELHESCKELIIEKGDLAFNVIYLVKDQELDKGAHNHPEADKKNKFCPSILKQFEEIEVKAVWKT
jgi:hypothetical protein